MKANVTSLRLSFGKRVRELRTQAGLSQEELAERAQISVDFVSLIERGINAPSFETLARLSRALGVSPRDLFDF
jgi:transcriptional regulator with XRE-family HTH domain